MDGLKEYCKEAIMDDEGNELVVPGSKCPRCGERRMDWLVWHEDKVECATCSMIYDPNEE